MLDSDLFCSQLEKVARILRSRHPEREEILLLMGNAKPHISKKSSEKLKDLGIELVPHPPHSPDLAPSDYHVFRSMQSFFAGKKFKKQRRGQTRCRRLFELKISLLLRSRDPLSSR
ncbi:hypothetical protein Y032_0754g2063 [Ancylostoma ceylanicum]|uniref:Tc1-like transposase DDE domain-containing protein n=1 Tax=Ancylostoma ceylanicum TaxID=53326 RepID=A0A016WFA3_9BILA|nr:hypothetical protein Y032_0754g2063 [Ancylostoma ceylanicum]